MAPEGLFRERGLVLLEGDEEEPLVGGAVANAGSQPGGLGPDVIRLVVLAGFPHRDRP